MAAAPPQKRFVYDAATFNRLTMLNAKGRLAEAYTGTSKTTDLGFGYSARGEVTDVYELTPHSSPSHYHASATYWESGMLKTLATNTALPTWTYNPDGEGRVLSVLAGSQNLVSSTTYNNFSSSGWQPQVVNLGSGDSDTFTFDSNTGRMTEYKASINASTAKGSLTWNQNGSLRSLAIADQFNPTNNQTCTYTHDDPARIGQVDCGSGKWGQTFTFDAFGNVTKTVMPGHMGTSFTPNAGLTTNQLTCTGCSYDSNGNLKADGPSGVGNTYAWDAEGNLSQFNLGTALVYDALGRRVEQTNASGTNEILYGPDGSKLALMNGTTVTKAFVPLPGGATAVYSGSTLGWYRHPDWLGSSRIASTPSRTVSYDGAASYSPFGESPTETGDHSFTGQNQDLVPNFLYDFPAREYHPGESRWLSPDPAGMAAADPTDPQSWNRYAYVRNSPMSLTDPLGLWLWQSGGCYYETVVASVNGEFQGYDTQPWGAGCTSGLPPTVLPQVPPATAPVIGGTGQGPSQPSTPPHIDCSSPPPLPPAPPGASVDANEQLLKELMRNASAPSQYNPFANPTAGTASAATYWLNVVPPGTSWDYKTQGSQYTYFGNFNYGATAHVLGLTLEQTQRGAGGAAFLFSRNHGPGNPLGTPANDNGMPVYGDQTGAKENQSVIAGWGYAAWQEACHQ